jgi:hypothetical protein
MVSKMPVRHQQETAMTLSPRVPRQLLLVTACLLAQAAFASDGEGLQLSSAPKWQARLQLSSQDASTFDAQRASGSRLLSANLLGDYYLTGSGLGGIRGGLRATGGMLLGPMSLSQASAGLALGGNAFRLGQNVAVGQRSLGALSSALGDATDSAAQLSYMGIGYTGQTLRGGFSFSADLGLVNSTTLPGLRLGRSNASGLEDVLRDLRYKPVLQLGLSYSY